MDQESRRRDGGSQLKLLATALNLFETLVPRVVNALMITPCDFCVTFCRFPIASFAAAERPARLLAASPGTVFAENAQRSSRIDF
jgi:hypothetical protein